MGKRGRKDCPNCNTEIGARTLLCPSCGYHFSSKEVRKDLLEESLKKKEKSGPIYYTELGRGRKECPSCKSIVGGVIKECPKCNFDFLSAKKVKDAEKEKIREKSRKRREIKKEETEKAREEKAKARAVKKEEKAEGYVMRTPMHLRFEIPEHKPYLKLTPQEHAERILSYGDDRARSLLVIAKINKGWKHVDWDVVEKGLVG